MDATVVAVVVIVLIVLAIAVLFAAQATKRRRLRERFGPEYERRVEDHGDRKAAEREMRDLATQRDKLEITPLDPQARERYAAAWNQVQGQFVDQPQAALDSAHVLVCQVMRDRGYPVDDFDTQADLVAVDHPNVVNHYRGAHDVQLRHADDVTTEDQRVALVHYRELFAELLDAGDHDRVRNSHGAAWRSDTR